MTRKEAKHVYLYVTKILILFLSLGILTHKGQSKSKYSHPHGW